MSVDRREIDEMARLRAILNGEQVAPLAHTPVPGNRAAQPLILSNPGVVSAAEIEQMARLRNIMAGQAGGLEESYQEPIPTILPAPRVVPDDSMSDFLRKVYESSDMVVNDGGSDRQLRRALATEKTPRGARVGNWEIAVTEGERKTYGVRSVKTGEEIAAELCVYEAAQALVAMLNDGMKINHPEVQEVLTLEAQYARNVGDAVQYRRVMRGGKLTEQRQAVLEDRFEDARSRAAHALNRLRRIVETR